MITQRGRAAGSGTGRTGPPAPRSCPGRSRSAAGRRRWRRRPRPGHRPAPSRPVRRAAPWSSRSPSARRSRSGAVRPRGRSSQPRTVLAGTPSCQPMDCGRSPAAAATAAVPITSTACARRGAHQAGSSTTVTRQDRQRARRGRTRARVPPSIQTGRSRACPHGASWPPHDTQHSEPAARSPAVRPASRVTSTRRPPSSRAEDAAIRRCRSRGGLVLQPGRLHRARLPYTMITRSRHRGHQPARHVPR